jgi:hypothetical protein
MPLEKVRMIHFALRTSAPRKALMALKALQSVTMIGTNYRDYAYRVSYAKMTVDPFLRSLDQKDVTSRSAIALAMRYHELAAQAWKANVLFETDSRQSADTAATVEHTLEEDTEIGSCTGLKRWIASTKARFDRRPKPTRAYQMPPIRGYKMPPLRPEDRFFLMGKNLGAEPAVLWQCASERISEAERLVGKQQGESLQWVEWGFGQPHPLLRPR